MQNKHEILLGLTTTPLSDWHAKVEEMKKFNIKRIALFPTFLKLDQRKELYESLEKIEGLVIPHVHLRGQNMEKWEMEWFEKHGAEVYNIHMGEHNNKILLKYNSKIFIENHIYKSIPEDQLKSNAGICLDFQHWERSKKIRPSVGIKTEAFANSYNIGCCHISALPKFKNCIFRLFKKARGIS